MILIDTGPLVAAFRRSDAHHGACRGKIATMTGPVATLLPVLTEAFYMLGPGKPAADSLRAMLLGGALKVHLPDAREIERAFDLMEEYADLPMDFADASLIAAAETLGTLKIFTLDRRDFAVYRIRKGRRRMPVTVV